MVYLLYILSWAGFYFLHSLLASSILKQKLESALPFMRSLYRLLYNLFSIGTLSLLVLWMFSLSSAPLFIIPLMVKYIAGGILFSGIILLFFSIYNYNLGDFSGLNQMLNKQGTQGEHAHLNINGLNRFVRHPLYLALVLIFISVPWFYLTWPVVITAAVSLFYLPLGIWSEEKKLVAFFGKAYEDYRKNVPAIIPCFKRNG
ncbi:MAG: hypothetical protein MH137_09180 [Flavobacteriales bacterium]|nr:hypothetical protein [Flavobacteriales bacterium]